MSGTVGIADIYGLPSGAPSGAAYETISVTNPNGASIAPPQTQTASGGAPGSDNQPALGLVGVILAVVLLRVMIQAFGERA